MQKVQIIPLICKTKNKPIEFKFEGAVNVPTRSSAAGFLLGPENKILKPIVQNVLDGTFSQEQQPILLYGMQGTGRTYLLKGLLETWRKQQKTDATKKQSYYMSCSDFCRQFTEAIANRTTASFRKRYRQARLLLLDDLEQLLGKNAAQTELQLLLDDFGGIMMITSQNLPNEILSGKGESLASGLSVRIQAGTTVPILPPCEAVRAEFLRDLASALRIPCTESAINTAAKYLTGTLPLVYAAVAQKYAEAKSAGEEALGLKFWQQFSQKQISNGHQGLTEIAKRTAQHFSLKLSELKGQSRCKTVALARSLAVYIAKSHLRLTFKEIGHFFGKRDPSTIRHLFEKVRKEMQTDTEIRDHLFRLECQS